MIGQKCRWLDRDDDGTSAKASGGHSEVGTDYGSYHPFLSISSVSSSQTKPATILRGLWCVAIPNVGIGGRC